MMSAGLLRPSVLIDITRIGAAPRLWMDDDHIHIGFRDRHVDMERAAPAIAAAAPLLPVTAPFIGNPAVRNRGTVVGSVAHADPSGEWPAVAVALDATVHVMGVVGSREVAVTDLIMGPMAVDLAPDEMITSMTVPRVTGAAGRSAGAGVYELAHRRGDYAIVGCVAQVILDSDRRIEEARFALFGLGDVPWRSSEVEHGLAGSRHVDIAERTADIAGRVEAASDALASSSYRQRVSAVVAERALTRAYDAALSTGHSR